MIDFILPQDFVSIYTWTIFVIAFFTACNYMFSKNNDLLLKQRHALFAFLLVALAIWFIGFRPVSGVFVDMYMYNHYFYNKVYSAADFSFRGEWLWNQMFYWTRQFHWTFILLSFFIALGYIFFPFIFCKKILYENVWVAMMFFLTAYSFWGYAVNGIRNGFATSLLILAFAFAIKKQYWVYGIICMMALGIHRSSIVPVASSILALTLIKNPKNALFIWVGSIVLSLLVGTRFQEMLGGLNYDDRMAGYASSNVSMSEFSYTGFRWDFLLYSSMPVFLIWYISVFKQIKDRGFEILSIIYLIANAFWIMVIRMPFSNRFAYLSWFLYPIVLAYGFIRVPFSKSQDRLVGYALFLHALFTLFMFLIEK